VFFDPCIVIQKLKVIKQIALLISQCHQQLSTDCWEQSACLPFNLELLLGDFHLCGSWKKDLEGKYFQHNDEAGAKANVMVW
jgi:hypothetical protein